ncbi:MAG: chromosome partitioning protein [Planctomycetota bacterium]|jgi:chromosome partitioning protein
MRRIAIINQKGGVGKTTTATNLGAALARAGKRVVVVDMDPQANLSLYLGCEPRSGQATIYSVLVGGLPFASALRSTTTPGLTLVPSHIDLSGAELELAATIGRETVLRDALETWEESGAEVVGQTGVAGPADYLLLDCPPSLGLLSINALACAYEVMIAVQTEFFALQGLGKLVEVVQLLKRRLNPKLEITGLLPSLYDSRLRLAREVLAELRRYFPGKVFTRSIRSNVKLAESPSHSQTIFEYAPESNGAADYAALALEVIAQEEAPNQAPKVEEPDMVAAANAICEAKPKPTEEAQVEVAPEPEPEPKAKQEVEPQLEPEPESEPVVELQPQEQLTLPSTPVEHQIDPPLAAEALPFGVILPSDAPVPVSPEDLPPSPEFDVELEMEFVVEVELEEELEADPAPVVEFTVADAGEPTPEPTPEPGPEPAGPKSTRVYGHSDYLGEDHFSGPGPGHGRA